METRKLSELKPTNPYLRLGTDVSELERSIRTLGLIAPLVVNNQNVILAGARRYQALLNLGFTEAPVMVIDKNSLEQELVSIDENLVRKDLSKLEIESHLRRAKEIYQQLHSFETPVEDGVEVLPAQDFLDLVAQRTGYSPKQIHQAIERDEKSSESVKEARKSGKLSTTQTNEIVKLNKSEQQKALSHIQTLPTKEIKKFVKLAKEQGVESALVEVVHQPFQKEFTQMESLLKRLSRMMKELESEDMSLSDYPAALQKKFHEIQSKVIETELNPPAEVSELESLH